MNRGVQTISTSRAGRLSNDVSLFKRFSILFILESYSNPETKISFRVKLKKTYFGSLVKLWGYDVYPFVLYMANYYLIENKAHAVLVFVSGAAKWVRTRF